MFDYQKPDCTMSVRDGLTQFRNVSGLADKMATVREGAKTLMDRHDVVHVIFGLDTSLRQEAIVDIWTVFGTTAQVTDIIAYLKLPEERAILKDIGCWKITATTLRAVPDLGRVYWASRKLKHKWPWDDHANWLDRPLDEVRIELGVTLLAA